MMIQRRPEFSLLEEMFRDPFFSRNEVKLMKTDIEEKDDKYLITIDLPGYSKEDIKLDVEDGYLNIQASVQKSEDEKDKKGNYIRRERFVGECSRSFYVGETIEPEDVKASFKNGTLCLEVPKKNEEKQIPEKKYIEIED